MLNSLRHTIAALFFLVSIAVSVQAGAQVSGGTLSGTITDTSRSPVPNVQINLRNVGTGTTRVTLTDAAGFYTAPDLLPGTYEVTSSARAFVTEVRTGIQVDIGANLILNITMQRGDPRKIIRAAVAAAPENQASSAISGNVNAATVTNSPLNGRDWTQLVTLQAGVTSIQAGAPQAQRGFGAPISISGARPDQNSYRLDGISINDYSNGAPGSVLGNNLGVDAVEQFSVLGTNYPADYGRTSGGVINAVTRSGTNAFHGTAYEFLRNSALDARNFFDRVVIPPFKRNQFGVSAGGPIHKDRTFFFGDYEGIRQSLGITQVDTVPSIQARAGLLSTGAVAVDPRVARFLQAFYPLPNGPLLGRGDIGIFTFAGQQVTTENYFTTKLDHKFSGRDVVYGTYLHDSSEVVQPDAFDDLISNVVSRRQLLTIHEEHSFSTMLLNAARFGVNRAVGIQGGVSQVLNPRMEDPSFGFVPGQFVGGVQNVPGLTDFSGGPNAALPASLGTSRSLFWTSFQWADDVFLTKGIHALRFGASVERMRDNMIQVSNSTGTFYFGSLADLLTDVPRTFKSILPLPTPVFGIRQTLVGAYIQDDIRVRRNLTLNAGLRYEAATIPSEVHDRISNLLNPTDAQPHIGPPYFSNPTLRNFEPRVGFAWSPFPNSNSLFRGGFGVFDILPLPYEFSSTLPSSFPFYDQIYGNAPPPGSFPTSAFQQVSTSSNSVRVGYIEPHPKRNYVMQWNLSVARQISSQISLTIAYVGSRGVHLPYRMDNLDMVLPALTPSGYLFPPTATSQTLNPNFGRISGILWQGNSFYNALQLVLAKTVSHGFQIHGAYTWGKSIDTLSSTVADNAFPNGLFNPLFFDQRTTRGLSDFDVPQTLVLSFTWTLPVSKGHSGFTQWAVSGWELGGIYKASDGQPFTPILGGDPLGTKLDETGEPPSYVSGCKLVAPNLKQNPAGPIYINQGCFVLPQATPAITAQCEPFGFVAGVSAGIAGTCANLLGNLGRNVLIGPGMSNLDFSVFKNTYIKHISEAFNAQFRAEFFNIFNRTNFASPTSNSTVFDQHGEPVSSAGLITSTQTTSRQIQLALKFIW